MMACNRDLRPMTRRAFLRGATAASGLIALPVFVPAWARGAEGAVPPSERIGVGLIGRGLMGRGHLHVLLGRKETQVLAVCDVDRTRCEEGRRIAWAHLGGWRWRYEFEPVEGGTKVTETFDWSTAKLKLPLEIAGTLGQLLFTQAFRVADMTAVMPFDFAKLIWAALLGWLVFHEAPSPSTLAGAAVIFLATSWIARVEARRGRSTPA